MKGIAYFWHDLINSQCMICMLQCSSCSCVRIISTFALRGEERELVRHIRINNGN